MSDLGVKIRCGLEIHQMLDTKCKLFCGCPTKLRTEEPDLEFRRWLRPTRSEMGELDRAALFEFEKGVSFRYQAYEDSVCLVEMDEEPPHPLNEEALEIALMIALLMGAKPVDEVQVMRKIVIDGSNTTGFQRTALIALDGKVVVDGKEVPIKTICLEEDAARKVGVGKDEVIYRLDRMGIPLIEIATAPVIESPEEAERVAFKIGQLLRITGRVKRGLGTIRQDLNVSIEGGARVEIKGVQELGLISKIVRYEALRQKSLLEIRDELRRRGVRSEDIKPEFKDVTHVFKDTKCRIARKALKSGGVALAVKLPGFKGLVGREIQPGRRLGTEFADRARYWAKVGGIFHSDELPAYGISEEEVERIKAELGCGENDAFVLVFERRDKAVKALEAVVERAREAVVGVPEETRAANPDGTTRFMRPMPGRARMYPETDIRPIPITEELLARIRSMLPEPPEKRLERLVKVYGLSEDMARRMLDSYHLDLFEKIVSELKVPAKLVASTLENTLVYLRREGVAVDRLTDDAIYGVFKLVAEGRVAKEAIPELLTYLAKNPEVSPEEAAEKLGLRAMTVEELEALVEKVLDEKADLVASRGERALGPLMGIIMGKVRGRIDGATVSEVVRRKLKERLSALKRS